MGSVYTDVRIDGVNGSASVHALVDTGARRNFIRSDLEDGGTVDDLGISEYRSVVPITLADNRVIQGKVVRFPRMGILDRVVELPEFVVFREFACEAVIGVLTMQSLHIVVNPSEHSVSAGTG